MSRRKLVVAACAGIAVVWGFGTAFVADAVGYSPLVAPATAVVLLAIFGWMRRGHDVVDVFASSFAVAYAAYIGLAVARVSQPNMLASEYWIAPLNERWPAVLMAGLPYALILTVIIAVPLSLIPRRRQIDAKAHERFWSFVREQNEMRMRPVTGASPDASYSRRRAPSE